MHPVFNLEHLRRYKPLDGSWGPRVTLPDTRDYLSASEEYVVEAILGHRVKTRKRGSQRMFLVRWEGYGPADDSWVSEYDLRNASVLTRDLK